MPAHEGVSETLQSRDHEPSGQDGDSHLMCNLLDLHAQTMLPRLAGFWPSQESLMVALS